MKTLKALLSIIINAFKICDHDLAESIKDKDGRSIILNLGLIILMVLGIVIAVIALVYLAFKFWWIFFIGFVIVEGVFALVNKCGTNTPDIVPDDVNVELARQQAMDMQGYALSLILRVLIAISSFTPVIRPRNTHDIEVRSTDGASFYMKDNIVIYQAEVEVEGEITPEVEDTIQRETQRYAQKYIPDYAMLISPEAGGCAPVEVLGVKNCGSRVLIDFVFTTKKAIPMIDARRRACAERQVKQGRIRPYIDEDYSE